MNAIDYLSATLAGSLVRELQLSEDPIHLRKIVRELHQRVHARDLGPPVELRLQACREFLTTGIVRSFRDMRYVCFGLTDLVPELGRRAISNRVGVLALLETTAGLPASRFRRCFQGLLNAYLSPYDPRASQSPSEHQTWLDLREFLQRRAEALLENKIVPNWARVLAENAGLLGPNPGGPYADAILDGRLQEYEEVRAALGVPATSWLGYEVARGAISRGCSLDDAAAQARVDRIIDLLEQYDVIADEGLAALLKRYSTMRDAQEHARLRDYAVARWGNPLHRQNLRKWDAAGETATMMVAAWLKSSLIEDFFELLSADGVTDRRRVSFWKRYVPHINDVYFALGRQAMSNPSEDFTRLRRTMGDNLLSLDGSTSKNNGFIMEIGRHVVVEFGEKGNAAFVFESGVLPFPLGPRVSVQGKTGWRDYAKATMLHVDGRDRWERHFEREMVRVLGVRPTSSGASVNATVMIDAPKSPQNKHSGARQWRFDELQRLCLAHGVSCSKNSAYSFVVAAGQQNAALSDQLLAMGFAFDIRRNCWRWEQGR